MQTFNVRYYVDNNRDNQASTVIIAANIRAACVMFMRSNPKSYTVVEINKVE